MKRKKIVILGSTGSIGENTLDVAAKHPDRFEILGLACGNNVQKLEEQIQRFRPRFAAVFRSNARPLPKSTTEIWEGEEGLVHLAAHPEADLVVSAIVGVAGLRPTYEALRKGKTVALANKESLVAAGRVMMRTAKENRALLLPVDSEHSAIHQALRAYKMEEVEKVILTASGGAFRDWDLNRLEGATAEQALKHPNWTMGKKITIDSATLMNKGLEIIEAHFLFDLPEEKIGVVIHPQSIIHSLVRYKDGSVLAQMGVPDMRTPIAYALAYPERIFTSVSPLDLVSISSLTFSAPDETRFRCLKLAREALKKGRTYPAVLNAANETAVQAFLEGRVRFLQIAETVEEVLEKHLGFALDHLEQVFEADRMGREEANRIIRRRGN